MYRQHWKKGVKNRRLAISRIFTVIIFVVALIVASVATIETLRLKPGITATPSLSTSTGTTTSSPVASSKASSSTTSSRTSSSTSSSSTAASTSTSISTTSSLSTSTLTTSTSTSANNNPGLVYIPTFNGPDRYGFTAFYCTLDSNTGTLGWAFETAQRDSIYSVSNNQLTQITNNFNQVPSGMTFDSSNNLAYTTYYIPGDGPTGISALTRTSVVNANLKLQSSPQDVAYDPQYDYLYVSVAPAAMTDQTELGVAVFNPNSGQQVAYLSMSSGAPAWFAYDPSSGAMFAAVSHQGTGTTIYEIMGTSIVSTFTLQENIGSGMVFNPTSGYLYVALQSGNILVLNPSNGGNIVGTIDTQSAVSAMVYDTADGNVYAFDNGQLLTISGTGIGSEISIPYNVIAALYNPPFNNILAFY